eukprot:SAG31_NODE_5954_length_2243_cov_3.423507_1_plen_440_part_00
MATDLFTGTLGIRTALDLQLVDAAGAEAEELFGSLKDGGLTVGARAKIRLLLLLQGLDAGARPISSHCHSEQRDSSVREGRMLQSESGDEEMSTDAIAIVLSVLVGGVGYIMQAITARRAEHAKQAQDRENHFAEMRRQREHEQMVAQIKRTERWLDDCCRPLMFQLHAYMIFRLGFVGETVSELEASHPEAVQAIMPGVAHMFDADEDGTLRTKYGTAFWRPFTPVLTRSHDNYMFGWPSAPAALIAGLDIFLALSSPFCSEAPQPILDLAVAEPTSAIAAVYRHYIKEVLMPACRRIVDIMQSHGPAIEWPSKDWLKEKYVRLHLYNGTLALHFGSSAHQSSPPPPPFFSAANVNLGFVREHVFRISFFGVHDVVGAYPFRVEYGRLHDCATCELFVIDGADGKHQLVSAAWRDETSRIDWHDNSGRVGHGQICLFY